MNEFLDSCRQAIGASYVLTQASDMASYLTDWRKRFTGRALAIVRPANTGEAAAVIRLCNQHHNPIEPQGDNTNKDKSSEPEASETTNKQTKNRMNRIRAIDLVNNTMTVEAENKQEQEQTAAAESGRLFPLSLAA